jgi:hypothetical protein
MEELGGSPLTPPLKKKSHIPQEVPGDNISTGGRKASSPETHDDDSNGVAQDSLMANSKAVLPANPAKAVIPNVAAVPSNPEKEQDCDPIGGGEIDDGVDVTASIPPDEETGDIVDTREDDEGKFRFVPLLQ